MCIPMKRLDISRCLPAAALFAVLMLAPAAATAQISLDRVENRQEQVVFNDTLKTIDAATDYFSPARYRAERAAIRKERNYIEVGALVQGSLTSYNDTWIQVSGGDNTVALIGNIWLRHIFRKERFSIETKLNGNLGFNGINVELTDDEGNPTTESIWFKNQDELALWVSPSWQMSKNWSYSSTFQFRSQFINGYISRTEQKIEHRKSSFMSPGYLDVSLGLKYKSPLAKFPIAIDLSPIAMSATFVESGLIRQQNGFTYGIEDPDKTSKYEGGSSVEINFDRTFGKSGALRYRTTAYSFFGWISDIGRPNKYQHYADYAQAMDRWAESGSDIKEKPHLAVHPTVRWTNAIEIRALKVFTTTFEFNLYYNRAQNLRAQTQMLLKVGLGYTFKNKEKP